MYDEDPVLFVAGAAGVGGLAFTGSRSWVIALIALAAIVGGLLLLRLSAAIARRADGPVTPMRHRAS